MITARFYNSLGCKDGIIFISQLSTACFLISWGSWRLRHGATCGVPPTRKVESQTGLLHLRVKGVSFSCSPWSQRFSKTKVLKSKTSLLLWAQKVLIFIGWFVWKVCIYNVVLPRCVLVTTKGAAGLRSSNLCEEMEKAENESKCGDSETPLWQKRLKKTTDQTRPTKPCHEVANVATPPWTPPTELEVTCW